MTIRKYLICVIAILALAFMVPVGGSETVGNSYPVVDTNQSLFYGNLNQVSNPSTDDIFYVQDAGHRGLSINYLDNGDNTVTDLNTGLMWAQDVGEKMSYREALDTATKFKLAGYSDWRVPTIKELYSLIIFSGIDPSGWNGNDPSQLTPFIDTSFFSFKYGDLSTGERIIDAQYVSSTKYVGLTMDGDETVFGVNFADGRIKGYGMVDPRTREEKTFFVKFVRGNQEYGMNRFIDNHDGSISDLATGLMWQQMDSKRGMNWEDALSYADNLDLAGHDDWRLPNAKELQSIVDYSVSPSTDGIASIDPLFSTSSIVDEGGKTNYPFFWSSTTHVNMKNGGNAVYVAFGEALGWMQPPLGGDYVLMDVHGSGAQRSDPKVGNASDYPHGHGPQGDVIRIDNYVRAVRLSSSKVSDQDLQQKVSSTSPTPFLFFPITLVAVFVAIRFRRSK